MNRIQLPYNKSTSYFILAFFFVPWSIGVYDYLFEENSFFQPDKTEKALNLIRWYSILTFIAALQYIPVFKFKEMERVPKEEALLKLPFLEFYLWNFAGIMLFFAFGGCMSIIENSDEKQYGMFLIGLGLSFISFITLNSNRVLFKGDYETAKDQKERIRKQTTEGVFKYRQDGFSFKHKIVEFNTSWNEIDGIVAYKTDNFTYDTIHLIIRRGKEELNFNEETDGWFVFKERMESNLKGINSKWELEVTFPPFEESATWVYKKGEDLNEKMPGSTYE